MLKVNPPIEILISNIQKNLEVALLISNRGREIVYKAYVEETPNLAKIYGVSENEILEIIKNQLIL